MSKRFLLLEMLSSSVDGELALMGDYPDRNINSDRYGLTPPPIFLACTGPNRQLRLETRLGSNPQSRHTLHRK